MSGDLRFLLALGVSVENAAKRIGRTPTAVRNELKNDDEEQEKNDE